MKIKFYLILVLLLLVSYSFAAIDTRLKFVSNYADPANSQGHLFFDVEIRGDGTATPIDLIQNAILLSETITVDIDTIYFDNFLLPDEDDPSTDGGYKLSTLYTILPDSSATWLRIIHVHTGGPIYVLPATTDWHVWFSVEVVYEPKSSTGTASWYPDPMPPLYMIFNDDNDRVEGEELPEPPELSNFTLDPQVVPVELASFSAESVDGQVNLQWITASETNNAGFYIEYSDSEEGPFTRLNSEMISGLGTDNNGRDYSFTDESGKVGEKRYYRLVDVDYNGNMMTHDVVSTTVTAPKEYALEQNFPNPFNPETTVKFKVKEVGFVDISIYNTAGQLVRHLVHQQMKPGSYDLVWNGKDENGQHVSSGTYFYRMQANNFSKVQKMQLLR
jgi:hypothetical protein